MGVGCGALLEDKRISRNGKYESLVIWRTEKKKPKTKTEGVKIQMTKR